MTNTNAKRHSKSNQKLLLFSWIIWGITVVVCTFFEWNRGSLFFLITSLLLGVVSGIGILFLHWAGRPMIDHEGRIRDCVDLLSTMSGPIEYAKDVSIICAGIMLSTTFVTRHSLWLLLAIPAYGGYLLWTIIIGPLLSYRSQQAEEEATPEYKKRMEKKKRQEERLKKIGQVSTAKTLK